MPLAPGPNELTAKIAPSGACSARACRVIPYRSSTSRSTNSVERPASTSGAFARRRAVRQHAVELGQEQRDRPAHAQVFGPLDVALQQVFDFLLPPPAFGGIGRALGVEAEEHGVAVGEEFLDRLLAAERDVLALVILDDQVESRGAVIEPELQLGLGQRARHRLARLDLRDLLRQVLGGLRVGRRQPQAGHPAARGLAVEHRQQRGLAHVAMTKQRDPLRPGQPRFQGVEPICAAVGLPHASAPRGASIRSIESRMAMSSAVHVQSMDRHECGLDRCQSKELLGFRLWNDRSERPEA